jgi:Zn-dependent protease with chaperone function
MNVYACLLIGSFAVAVLAPRILPRLTHSGRAPRLAVVVWALAIGSVAISWLAAPALLLTDLLRPSPSFTRACLTVLRSLFGGRSGPAVQVLVFAVAFLLVTRITKTLVSGYRASCSRTRRHIDSARIVGRRVPGMDAYILDSDRTAAYCLPGRNRTIVLSTGALAALTRPQLAAVLAHERAHLAGHHHLLLRLSNGLRTSMPRVRLFSTGAEEIARLLEMCADDAAARRHGRAAVAGALAALTGSHAPPLGALAAYGPTTTARVWRLEQAEDQRAKNLTRVMLSTAALVLLTGPALTLLLAAQGLSLCPTPAA